MEKYKPEFIRIPVEEHLTLFLFYVLSRNKCGEVKKCFWFFTFGLFMNLKRENSHIKTYVRESFQKRI